MTKLKSIGIVSLIIVSSAIQWAFYDPYASEVYADDPPGVIQAIGNAGSDQVFTFKKWKIESLNWEAGKYEGIKLSILIDCKSLSTDWKDLEKNVRKKKDYFYVKKFPTAQITINGASNNPDGTYNTEMELTLKGITKTVPLTFKIDPENNLKIIGNGELNRRKFKFNGGGPKDEVPLHFEITLPNQNI